MKQNVKCSTAQVLEEHRPQQQVVLTAAQSNQQLIEGAAVKHWPYRIGWELMRRFDERDGDYRLPEDASLAIIKCMLAIAQLRTHDPVVLQRISGYPLRFITSLVWILLQNERWMFEGAYLELSYLAAVGDEKALDSRLYSMLEGV
jgi:hypothetical protein